MGKSIRSCAEKSGSLNYSNFNSKIKAMQRNNFIALVIFLSMGVTASAQKIQSTASQLSKTAVILFKNQETAYSQLQRDIQKLEQQKASLLLLMKQYDENQQQVVVKMQKLEAVYDSINVQTNGITTGKSPESQGQLLSATKQMQETQLSFNLQYLQLQSQMQQENRSYTAVSNIMKTKHDTVKNSISNVR